MTPTQEAMERIRRELEYINSVESVGLMVKVADVNALLASHENLKQAVMRFLDLEPALGSPLAKHRTAFLFAHKALREAGS